MVEDNTLFKIAFATSILGLIGMILFSGQVTPKQVHIVEVNNGMLDEDVSVEGVVCEIKQSQNGKTYFLELMDNTGKIDVVVFEKDVQYIEKNSFKMNSLINRRIKIFGTVAEYNGRLELELKDAKSLKIVA